MTRNLFIEAGEGRPSARWQEAFPAAAIYRGAPADLAAAAGDVLWLSTASADWPSILGELLARLPAVPVVIVSSAPASGEALAALEAGARGYCHAYAVPGQLREIAQVVAMGGLWIGPELVSRFVGVVRQRLPESTGALPASVSAREAEVAQAVASGLSNKEVAARLGITERTVKAHLGALFEKLGVRDRLQLVLRLSGRAEPDAVG